MKPAAAASPANPVAPKASTRLLYVDNIRIFLTMLVIAHHLMVIYTHSGGWIYYENRQDDISAALGGWFSSVNQAYFMGLFLFVAAYFVPGAYDRKGPAKFITDRLLRLGLPLALYSWLLRPLYLFFGLQVSPGSSFWSWYTQGYFRKYSWLGGGPLWFIEALLLFSLVYALWRQLRPTRQAPAVQPAPFPASRWIAVFALLLGGLTFLVRTVSPVNATFLPLNLQFANFAQYIALFVLGLVAYRRDWLATLPESTGRLWLGLALLIAFIYAPLALLTGGAQDDTPFLGGWHWQALLFAEWEAFQCVSMCLGLLSLFRRRLDRQGALARELSRSAYAAYLLHEPFITALAIAATGVLLPALLKFALACLVFIPLSFALGSLVRRIPSFDRVL